MLAWGLVRISPPSPMSATMSTDISAGFSMILWLCVVGFIVLHGLVRFSVFIVFKCLKMRGSKI